MSSSDDKILVALIAAVFVSTVAIAAIIRFSSSPSSPDACGKACAASFQPMQSWSQTEGCKCVVPPVVPVAPSVSPMECGE